MTESKKEWRKPELIVLVRGKPEEAVLSACKGFPLTGTIAVNFNWCAYPDGCVVCTGNAPS